MAGPGEGGAAEGGEEDWELVDESPLRRFLRGARPNWTPADLAKVESKLAKVDIDDLPTLLMSLKLHADAAFNAMFKAVDEKGFAPETLRALRGQQSQALPGAQPVRVRKSAEAPVPKRQPQASRPQAARRGPAEVLPSQAPPQQEAVAPGPAVAQPEQVALAPSLPWPGAKWQARPGVAVRQCFRVAQPGPEGTGLAVQEWPALEAPEIGRKLLDERVQGEEETFDGWVRLADEPGWMLRHACFQNERLVLLSPVGEELLLATPEISSEPGTRRLEVIFQPRVPVREAPSMTAKMLGTKDFGETVLAESQTYDGWVRLAGGEGWMLSFSRAEGPLLLLPVEEQASWREQRSLGWQAVSAVRFKLPTIGDTMLTNVKHSLRKELERRDPARIRGAVLCAKSVGYNGKELRSAELFAEALRRGWTAPSEKGEAVEAAGAREAGAAGGQEAGAEEALEKLRAAVASGDAAAIRAAVNAAKAAGVPKREIARAYALQCPTEGA